MLLSLLLLPSYASVPSSPAPPPLLPLTRMSSAHMRLSRGSEALNFSMRGSTLPVKRPPHSLGVASSSAAAAAAAAGWVAGAAAACVCVCAGRRGGRADAGGQLETTPAAVLLLGFFRQGGSICCCRSLLGVKGLIGGY